MEGKGFFGLQSVKIKCMDSDEMLASAFHCKQKSEIQAIPLTLFFTLACRAGKIRGWYR
jgi:hypothetical protein